MALSLIEGLGGEEGDRVEGDKDEGVGQNKGEDEESLLGRMKESKSGVTN